MNLLLRNNNLGCNCQNIALGAVSDYDVITVGGQQYSTNQILDKQLIAKAATPLYHSDFKTPFRTVAAGQPIGVVYSYLKPSGSTGKSALMLYDNTQYTGTPYYVLNEAQIDTQALQDQGTLTVSQEIQAEQDKLAQQNDPVGYYLKKFGLPALLIAGGVLLAATFGREFIKDKVLKKA